MNDVPAVVSAVRLLERIAADWPDPVASGTLIDELGLNRSTCYNILGTLQRVGWVASKGDRAGWSLGPRLLAMSRLSADLFGDIVQQELDALSQRIGFIVFAVQKAGAGEYTVFAKGDRGQGVRITVGIGDTFPFSAPAIMRAFHAWSDQDEVDRLVAQYGVTEFTPATATSPGLVRDKLRIVRQRGYATSVREYDLGQSGVSAPVFDERGRVTAVIVSLAFSSELNESNADRYGELIRECGRRITERSGGKEPAAE
ncbi:MAG TPA: IclR family transcriptional regulator [Pseudonocardiaceae bacterium]|jgi:DNA-binding IclR family transcriptional regulator|nr:IclR family transcriptional regulator [Pseudonocardiaceae bacterium]